MLSANVCFSNLIPQFKQTVIVIAVKVPYLSQQISQLAALIFESETVKVCCTYRFAGKTPNINNSGVSLFIQGLSCKPVSYSIELQITQLHLRWCPSAQADTLVKLLNFMKIHKLIK
jgi:hypothetical protein